MTTITDSHRRGKVGIYNRIIIAVALVAGVIPVLGLLLAIAMLSGAKAWTAREKAIGSLVPVASTVLGLFLFTAMFDGIGVILAYVLVIVLAGIALTGASF